MIFRRLLKNKVIRRLLDDAGWRVRLSLLGSVSLNVLYVLTMVTSGLFFRAYWFYALAAYYLILIIMRIFLLKNTAKTVPWENRLREFYRYRVCGILILVMSQALAVLVYYVVRQNKSFEYNSIHTIAMATYTFAAIIWATVSVVKYRRYESPLMSAAKAISLASATVSLISLETSMVDAFGKHNEPHFRQTMTAVTGTLVCVFVLGMAIYMIIRANKQIKILKVEKRK